MWHLINDRLVKCYLTTSDNNIKSFSFSFFVKLKSSYYKPMYIMCFYLFTSAFRFTKLFSLALAFKYQRKLLDHRNHTLVDTIY